MTMHINWIYILFMWLQLGVNSQPSGYHRLANKESMTLPVEQSRSQKNNSSHRFLQSWRVKIKNNNRYPYCLELTEEKMRLSSMLAVTKVSSHNAMSITWLEWPLPIIMSFSPLLRSQWPVQLCQGMYTLRVSQNGYEIHTVAFIQ